MLGNSDVYGCDVLKATSNQAIPEKYRAEILASDKNVDLLGFLAHRAGRHILKAKTYALGYLQLQDIGTKLLESLLIVARIHKSWIMGISERKGVPRV